MRKTLSYDKNTLVTQIFNISLEISPPIINS